MKVVRPSGFHKIRRDKLMHEDRDDAYKLTAKLAEPTRCPECGAVFQHARWQWAQAPAASHEAICPACHRVRDGHPAGFVTLSGKFLHEHRDEILHLVQNQAQREKAEHPLKRIIKIQPEPEGLTITTTDIHLARAIGDALHHAYQGELDYQYNPEEYLLRVSWSR
jgi:NMD protein affecting ribosome stability and mRNA decay